MKEKNRESLLNSQLLIQFYSSIAQIVSWFYDGRERWGQRRCVLPPGGDV